MYNTFHDLESIKYSMKVKNKGNNNSNTSSKEENYNDFKP
jgi:hypothetical protein